MSLLSRHVVSASTTIPLPQPDTVIYTENFATSAGGWTGSSVAWNNVDLNLTVAFNDDASTYDGIAYRALTGLTVGRIYTFTAQGITYQYGRALGLGILGRAMYPVTPVQAGVMQTLSITFTATATSHTIQLRGPFTGPASSARWDNVKLTALSADVPTLINLPIKNGSLTLDEGWAPYAQGTIEIPIPSIQILAALDPRKSIRVNVSLASMYGDVFSNWNPEGYMSPTTRVFNLLFVGRQIDHASGTLKLALASDESILQSYAWVSSEPRLLSTTSAVTAVRDVFALALPGAALNVAATLSSKPTVTRVNLLPNPSFETNGSGYTGDATRVTVARVATGTSSGGWALSIMPASTTASCFLNVGTGDTGAMRAGMVAGKTYTLSANFRLLGTAIQPAGVAALGSSLYLAYHTAGQAAGVYTEAKINTDINTVSNVRLSLTVALPMDATEAFIRIYHPGRSTTGQVPLYIDALLLEETDEYRPFFDGSMTSSPEITYAWTGTANASTSTAVVRAHVSGEATTWKPGVSAWEYLSSLLTASSMRLFCDEQRVWRLVDSAYNIPGSVRLSEGVNLVGASDEIARNNDGTWFDAVVIEYKWTDFDGSTQIKYDVASMPNPQQVRRLEMEAVYPGPGAAAYILRRAYGRGRVLGLRGISDYSTQPGMEATATLPLSPVQSGYISAVTWDLSSDEMDIETRGLIDTPTTAWNQAPVGKAWADVAAGVTWNTYTN